MCCLEGLQDIAANSVDLMCCDLPYGSTKMKWDCTIDLEKLWKEIKRVLTEFGTVILFGKQPFTSKLVLSNPHMFKYSLVWKKSKPGNFAQAPYRFLCEHEDILVFSYGNTTANAKHKMKFNPQYTSECFRVKPGKTGKTHHRKNRKTQKKYVQKVTNYPRSILSFGNEGHPVHPTQKPLNLVEYLVKTFSDEGDTVMDVCFGSGTTAIACIKSNRKFIGFEKNKLFFDLAQRRVLDYYSNNNNNK